MLDSYFKAKNINDCETCYHTNVNIEEKINGYTPLLYFCERGNYEIVEWLIGHNANVCHNPKWLNSAIQIAASGGYVKIIDILIKHGANINDDSHHTTPLIEASISGHVDVIDYLLEKEANVNLTSTRGTSPLMVACFYKNVDVVDRLLEFGCNINQTNIYGFTEMMFLISRPCIDEDKHKMTHIFNKLIVSGVIIDNVDKKGNMLLNLACKADNHFAVDLILSLGSYDINHQNHNGVTTLMQAAKYASEETFTLILTNGADVSLKDNRGRTVFDFCKYRTEIENILETFLKK